MLQDLRFSNTTTAINWLPAGLLTAALRVADRIAALTETWLI